MSRETNPCADARARFHPASAAPPTTLRGQFGNPTGVLGWAVGRVMSVNNAKRSAWVRSLLDLAPGQRVLEIGFGPGNDVAAALPIVGERGRVAGVDHSPLMVRQAQARCRGAGDRVDLRVASACALPFDDGAFDRVFSINSVQFWEDRLLGLCEVRRVLAAGGRALIAIQPRNAGATVADSDRWARSLEADLRAVGFESVELGRDAGTPPTVAAIAR